jgi:hypothetical protein
MLSRLIIKRFCHSHGKTKCYENIHKIESVRKELNEIKEFLQVLEKPLRVIYTSSVLSLISSLIIIVKTPF